MPHNCFTILFSVRHFFVDKPGREITLGSIILNAGVISKDKDSTKEPFVVELPKKFVLYIIFL